MVNLVYLAYVVVIFAVVKRIKASVATSKVTFGFFLGGGGGGGKVGTDLFFQNVRRDP